MPTAKHRTAANLTDTEFGELVAMAEKYDVSLAWLARKAIVEFIERHRAEQLSLPLSSEIVDRNLAGPKSRSAGA